MITLSKEDKELILNFYFRCGTNEEIIRARDLIASDPRAADLYARLEETLQQLDSVKYEPCPDNLADLTVAKLKMAANKGHKNLNLLLEQHQSQPQLNVVGPQGTTAVENSKVKSGGFFGNFSEVAAVAAIILIAVSILLPTSAHLRQKAWEAACSLRLSNIFDGMERYAGDHAGSLPAVSMAAGSPWYKIGQDTEKSESNTRHLWLLARDGYVSADQFVCPARKNGKPLNICMDEAKRLFDFPSSKNVSFSFILMTPDLAKKLTNSDQALLADRNPIFETVYDEKGVPQSLRIHVSDEFLNMLSRNHRGRGQNVLFRDGSVRFLKQRRLDNDDIYTLEGKKEYSGVETPSDGDIFLAP